MPTSRRNSSNMDVSGTLITLVGSGTNTQTMPSSSQTLVGRTSTDTLTNKTLTTPTITVPVIAATDWTNANHTHRGASTGGKLPIYVTYIFGDQNIATTATSALPFAGAVNTLQSVNFGGTITQIPAAANGSFVSLLIHTGTARTGGTATARFNLASSTLTNLGAVIDGTNTRIMTAAQALDIDTFTSGQLLGCDIVTASFTPGGAVEMVVYMTVAYYI